MVEKGSSRGGNVDSPADQHSRYQAVPRGGVGLVAPDWRNM